MALFIIESLLINFISWLTDFYIILCRSTNCQGMTEQVGTQMCWTGNQLYFILCIWARFGIIYSLIQVNTRSFWSHLCPIWRSVVFGVQWYWDWFCSELGSFPHGQASFTFFPDTGKPVSTCPVSKPFFICIEANIPRLKVTGTAWQLLTGSCFIWRRLKGLSRCWINLNDAD